MPMAVKRATVYLDAKLHRAFRIKSIETARSMSKLVNESVTVALAEDVEDLAAFEERAREPRIAFEDALRELKRHGKIRNLAAAVGSEEKFFAKPRGRTPQLQPKIRSRSCLL